MYIKSVHQIIHQYMNENETPTNATHIDMLHKIFL